MKALLTSLRQRILTELTYLHDTAVHLLPDEDLLPEYTPFPCVGLKDGAVQTSYRAGGTQEELAVDLIAYVLINAPEAVIVGKGDQKGILDVMADVKAALEEYDPAGYLWSPGPVPGKECHL